MLLPINYFTRLVRCCIQNTCDWQMRTSPCGSSARRNGLHSGHVVERCATIGEMIRQTTRLFFKLMRSPLMARRIKPGRVGKGLNQRTQHYEGTIVVPSRIVLPVKAGNRSSATSGLFAHPLNEAGESEYSLRNVVFRAVWICSGVLFGLWWFLEFGGLLGIGHRVSLLLAVGLGT
jgi:hypothetical protein